MLYDTIYRHNQALSPAGLETVPAALHALNAAVEDCSRAGKSIASDASVLLLIHILSEAADRVTVGLRDLRARCLEDRRTIEAAPALLAIAGHHVDRDPTAKRTFHAQTRRALARLVETMKLDPDTPIKTTPGTDREDGITALRHPAFGIQVIPHGLLPDSEICFYRCVDGSRAGRCHHAPIGSLLDPDRLSRHLEAAIGQLVPPRLAAA